MKTLYKTLAALAAIVVCISLAAVAQDKPAAKKPASHTKATDKKPPSGQAAPSAAGMGIMGKPSAETGKLIKMFGGTWSSTEKHEVSEFMPQGGTGAGTLRSRPGPGGNSLIEDYRSAGAMGSFSGHGIIYWDDKQKAYSSIWCDSMTPSCEVGALGKWTGNDLVFHAESEFMGKKWKSKQVYTDIKPDSMTFYIDSSVDGGPSKRMMTIQYTRKPPAPPASQER